jgi:hypothetical protein
MEFTDHSKEVRKQIQQRLVAGLNRGNQFLISEARDAAPVKSGDLRDNTEIVREASEGNAVAVGASKAPYARLVNLHVTPFWTQAWIRMKAQMGEFFRG